MAIMLGGGGRRRRRIGRRGRFAAARFNSFGKEDKHDEAAPMAASDRSPTAGNDGNYDGCERRHRALLGLGFPREGERQVRGERGKQRASGLLLTAAGGHGSEAGEEDTAMRRPWRQWVHCRHSEDGADRRGPPVRFSFFSLFFFWTLNTAGFSYLNEVLRHFHKFYKNSYGL